MNILERIFGRKVKETSANKTNSNTDNSELSGLEKFKSKSLDERMMDIMMLGDTGNPKVFEILEYAIQNDNDSNVVMAALKRIHLFKENEELIPFLTELKNTKNMDRYEPYYSMALSRTGIISFEEFENKINGNK